MINTRIREENNAPFEFEEKSEAKRQTELLSFCRMPCPHNGPPEERNPGERITHERRRASEMLELAAAK